MSGHRTLIWTPTATAELQRGLHEAVVGPAALVPVRCGTVLLPRRERGFADVARLAEHCRAVGEEAVLVRWNLVAEVWTDGKQWGYYGHVLPLVGLRVWWRLHSSSGRLDLPMEVRRVRALVDQGRADLWIAGLPRRMDHPINMVLPVVPVTQGGAPLA